ncbi:SEC-C metal-binding domain-containing protein [Micromonospora sp. L31]|uniref:SEC-C metal-binding domain-containing protein n=1 Tax=Micromonospora sp. L31 TaxID=3452213 RepID=UPI003F8BBA4C
MISYGPDRVFATSDVTLAVSSPQIAAVSPGARPTAVPIVPRKWPCPCGSGDRYKDCHGQLPRQRRR